MKQLRLSLLGFGRVGEWLVDALHRHQAWWQQELGLMVILRSVATAHYGLIYRDEGLDLPTLLRLGTTRQPLTAHPEVTHWANILEGLQATGGDVLAEATGANLRNVEPGLSYIRAALSQGMHVVTSSKGPMALAGLDLLALARAHGVQLRMEATVMSGTPVLSTLREGMAGTHIRSIRGVLNGTANYILSAIMTGSDYAAALAEAPDQRLYRSRRNRRCGRRRCGRKNTDPGGGRIWSCAHSESRSCGMASPRLPESRSSKHFPRANASSI